jgi:hypothetical protein
MKTEKDFFYLTPQMPLLTKITPLAGASHAGFTARFVLGSKNCSAGEHCDSRDGSVSYREVLYPPPPARIVPIY